MEHSSLMWHSQPVSPLEEATYWLELLAKYRSLPHLKIPSHHLSLFQYFSLDIIFLMSCLWLAVCLWCLSKCFNLSFRKKEEGKTTRKEKKHWSLTYFFSICVPSTTYSKEILSKNHRSFLNWVLEHQVWCQILLLFLMQVFSFSNLVYIKNYNWVMPSIVYSWFRKIS